MDGKESTFEGIVASLSSFFTSSRVKGVRRLDALPDDLDTVIRQGVVEKKRCSWFDDRIGEVMVFGPAVNGFNKAFWQSQVLRAGIERFGISDLFAGSAVADVVRQALNRRLGTSFSSLRDVESMLVRMLRERSSEPNVWSDAGVALVRPFGLEESPNALRWALESGLKGWSWRAGRKAVSAGDYSLHDEAAAGTLEAVLSGNGGIRASVLSFGPAGEAYRRVGYPAAEVKALADNLVCFLKESGVDPVSFGTDGLVSLVQDPLMIVKSMRTRPDGTSPFVAVLDRKVDVPGYGKEYLAVSMKSPEEFLAKAMRFRSAGKDAHLLLTPLFLSEKAVLATLCDPANWKYLRPAGGPDSTFFEYVERLKKGGATASPVYENSGSRQRLLTVTNIAENFRNPMSSERYSQMYGYERDPMRDALGRRAAVAAEAARLDREAAVEAAADRKADKFLEPFPVSVVEGAARDRLFAGGIRNAGDVVREGFDRVRELAGTDRAVNRIADWMAGKDIYVYPKEGVRPAGAGRPTADAVMSHFFDTVLRAVSVSGGSMPFPMRLSGEFFTGADAMHLMAASLMQRTKGCPVWATESELLGLGCRIGKAEPVPVFVGGRPENVYNVSATEFPKRYPAEYGQFLDSAKAGCSEDRESGRYFGIILGSLGVAVRENVQGLAAWMDHSTSPAFQALREARGPSLEAVVGDQGIKEMRRRGKALKMYDAVKDANSRAKRMGKGV